MTAERPSWDEWGLELARAVSTRADCTRRRVGAVVIDETHSVVSTGYNGAPSGAPGCLSDGACPRGRHRADWTSRYEVRGIGYHALCTCGSTWPCSSSVEPGSSYDTGAGSCIAIHAEANALLRAGMRARGCTLYLTDLPCDGCQRMILRAGIARVVWPGGQIGIGYG